MPPTLSVFKKFSDLIQAQELAFTLEENGISVELVNSSPGVDITFSGNTLQNQVELKIAEADFDKAQQLLQHLSDIDPEEVDPDHYLFDLTDEELKGILLKPDEWSEFDVLLAQKILKSRGGEITAEQIEAWKQERLKEIAQPLSSKRVWIVLGYKFSVLGGLLGIFIGYFLWNQLKTLPNGTKVFTYIESDRKHGRNMVFIGIAVILLAIVLAIMGE